MKKILFILLLFFTGSCYGGWVNFEGEKELSNLKEESCAPDFRRAVMDTFLTNMIEGPRDKDEGLLRENFAEDMTLIHEASYGPYDSDTREKMKNYYFQQSYNICV